MENELTARLRKYDPKNLPVTIKITSLVLSLVILVILIFFTLGLRTLHNALIQNASNHLEELCYLKSAEVEKIFGETRGKVLELSRQDNVNSAIEELTSSFHVLTDDAYSILQSTSMAEAKSRLGDYYEKMVAPNSPLSGDRLIQYLPDEELTLLAQYQYLVNNPKPFEQNEDLIGLPDNNSAYSSAHKNYQAFFLGELDKLVARNIYLIDPHSGFVVYSVKKEIDFGRNLLDGKLKDSKLSEAFRMGKASAESEVSLVDYSNYLPACDKPVMFMAVPVYQYNELKAVLVVQFDTRFLDNILTKEDMAAGESTLEYTLIGSDLALRNNPKDFLLNRESYLKKLKRKTNRHGLNQISLYEKTESMAMLTNYPLSSKRKLLSEGLCRLTDYNGIGVIAYSKPTLIGKLHYNLIAKINRSEVLQSFTQKVRLFILLSLVLLGIILIIAMSFGKALTRQINMLLDALMQLHNGEKAKSLPEGATDEVGAIISAYNKLRKRINNAEEFALEMSEGNYNYVFEILGERDSLGKSLNVLKDKLIQSRDEHEERTKEDEIRNWISSGVAKFNDLLRQNNNDISLLAYSIIENLTAYVDANVGGIYLIEGDRDAERHISLAASYAYDRRKYHKKSFEINEGLLGACYMEKKSIYLKDIPEDYIEITSGLGHQVPKCLYIVPLKVDEDVLGIIEVASIHEFDKHHLEFIEQVSGSIASTFVSVRLNMKTAVLLEESKRKAEEITQQEEEMRQNLEEMQATQEELARLRQDDEKHSRELQLIIDNTRFLLKNLLDTVPGGYVLKDQSGIIHIANSEGAEIYGLPVEKIIGKTEHELLGAKIFEAEHAIDMNVLEKGEKEYTEEREIKGKKKKFRVIKKPFEIKEIGQIGIFTMRFQDKD
jgi:PAS domain S-box-containing protein